MFGNLTPAVKNLLIVNIAMYFIPILLGSNFIQEHLALYDYNSPYFRPYQLFTHMFLHGGGMHLFMNMLGLFFLGPLLERIWGSNRFLIFYLVCGIGASLLYSGIIYYQGISTRLVGASGAIYGLLMAAALLFPNTEFQLIFPPVRIKAKYIALILGGIALLSGLRSEAGDNVAHFAHLGGMLFAYILLKLWEGKKGNFY